MARFMSSSAARSEGMWPSRDLAGGILCFAIIPGCTYCIYFMGIFIQTEASVQVNGYVRQDMHWVSNEIIERSVSTNN